MTDHDPERVAVVARALFDADYEYSFAHDAKPAFDAEFVETYSNLAVAALDALEEFEDTKGSIVDLIKRAIENSQRSTYLGYSQSFVGDVIEAANGLNPDSFASAAHSYRASTIESLNPLAAPPGAIHYFENGRLGYNGIAVGDGFVALPYGKGAHVDLGKGIGIRPVYAVLLRYLGWSLTNGPKRKPIEGYSAWDGA